MKCLSLWQYWASLVVLGEKEFETRSWHTSYRGPLLIHAAKTNKEVKALQAEFARMTPSQHRANRLHLAFERHGIQSVDDFPYGALLGTVQLVACYQMTPYMILRMNAQELDFGNWQPGRFAWHLLDPKPFAKPVPSRGHQGLFEIPIEVHSA